MTLTWKRPGPVVKATKAGYQTAMIQAQFAEKMENVVAGNPLSLIERLSDLPLAELDVLDLGCGVCESPISSQVLMLPFKKLASVDVHPPALATLRSKFCAAAEHEFLEGDIAKVAEGIPAKSYDIVLMLDSLEHLTRDKAFALLRTVHYIARQRILIWLPIGYCPQDEYGGNPHQFHHSTWEAIDLEREGYHVMVFKEFHRHFSPPVDAAWARKDFSS